LQVLFSLAFFSVSVTFSIISLSQTVHSFFALYTLQNSGLSPVKYYYYYYYYFFNFFFTLGRYIPEGVYYYYYYYYYLHSYKSYKH